MRIERVDCQSYDKVVLVLRIELVESSIKFSNGRTWLREARLGQGMIHVVESELDLIADVRI